MRTLEDRILTLEEFVAAISPGIPVDLMQYLQAYRSDKLSLTSAFDAHKNAGGPAPQTPDQFRAKIEESIAGFKKAGQPFNPIAALLEEDRIVAEFTDEYVRLKGVFGV